MRARLWTATLAACAVVAGTCVVATGGWLGLELTPGTLGTLHARLGLRVADGSRPILDLDARSPLAIAGAKAGDRLVFDRAGDRFRRLHTDEEVGLTLIGVDGARHVVVRPAPDPVALERPRASALDNGMNVLVAALALVVGLLIGWRQRHGGPLRVLALVCLTGSVLVVHLALPGGWYLDHLAAPVNGWLYGVVFAGFAYFCLAFPAGASIWSSSKRVRIAFVVFVAFYAALAGALTLAAVGLLPSAAASSLADVWEASHLLALAVAVAGLWVNGRQSHGAARQRIAWVGLSVGTGLAVSTLGFVLPALGIPIGLDISLLQSLLVFACLCGLGYAVLRGRVLDSGFAVNRVLVHGVFGLLMFGTAWLAATVADRWLGSGPGAASTLRDVALAGVLVAAWTPYRAAAERGVLTLLYPRWRAVDAALDGAVEAAGHIRGHDALVDHYLAAVRDYAGGAANAFYERQADTLVRVAGDWTAAPRVIDADAVTVAVLHAGRLPPSIAVLAAEYAIAAPVVHRDRLTGVLLVAGRPDFQGYRPDESRRIRNTATLLGDDLQADAERNQQAVLEAKHAAEQEARLSAERLRDAQRELVRRFATPEVAADLEKQGFALGGRRLRATTLFCDIRGFTALAEHGGPEGTIELLNGYYACVFEAIAAHGGVVNQIVGDGLMAIFGAPVPLPDAPAAALRAAVDMLRLLEGFNARRAEQGEAMLRVGIGIATGDVVAGYTGTDSRATYTCVGDAVNLAARLEAMTKELQQPVLVDGETHAAAAGEVALVRLGRHAVRGRSNGVEVFALAASGSPGPS